MFTTANHPILNFHLWIIYHTLSVPQSKKKIKGQKKELQTNIGARHQKTSEPQTRFKRSVSWQFSSDVAVTTQGKHTHTLLLWKRGLGSTSLPFRQDWICSLNCGNSGRRVRSAPFMCFPIPKFLRIPHCQMFFFGIFMCMVLNIPNFQKLNLLPQYLLLSKLKQEKLQVLVSFNDRKITGKEEKKMNRGLGRRRRRGQSNSDTTSHPRD